MKRAEGGSSAAGPAAETLGRGSRRLDTPKPAEPSPGRRRRIKSGFRSPVPRRRLGWKRRRRRRRPDDPGDEPIGLVLDEKVCAYSLERKTPVRRTGLSGHSPMGSAPRSVPCRRGRRHENPQKKKSHPQRRALRHPHVRSHGKYGDAPSRV